MGMNINNKHLDPSTKFFDEFFDAYVICALWSSTDERGDSLDDNYNVNDIHPDSLKQMKADCGIFVTANAELLHNLSPCQCGHDFWLTRNHHGAGFWDRGLGEVGDKLTDACKTIGECDLYVGDDGKLHLQ